MSKNMTPAQVAAKIAKFKAKQEATLKKYPVGPMANSARINLNKAEAALAALQETNEGMRIGKQPQAQMGAPMPNDMDYMQARYGGYTKPEFAEGGPTGEPLSKETLTPALQDMLNLLVSDYGWTEQNALLGLSVAHKESKGLPKSEMDYSGTSNARIRGIFGSRVPASEEELTALKADPDAFFEKVYGVDSSKGATLGNTEPGDGNKFRGRGLIQITGRDNYAAASQAIFGDDRLLDNPDLLMEPDTAGKVGAWWIGDKAKNGINDFDVTQDIPAENVQNFLNGVYSEVSSAGTGSSQTYRDNLGLGKDGQMNPDSIYHAGMGRMQSFVNQVLPNLNWDEDKTTPAVEVDNSNDVSNANSLMFAEPVVEEGVYDETPGEAPPEATVNMQDQLLANRFYPSNEKVKHTKESFNALSKEEKKAYFNGVPDMFRTPMDLNFHRAELIGDGEPIFTEDNRFAYAQNEHGDWNVYDSQTGHHSMVRHANMLGEKGDSAAWKQAVAADGIAYDPQVNGADTADDKSLMFTYSDFGAQTMGPAGPGSRGGMAYGYAERQDGVAWGNDIDFDTAIDGNLAAMGIEGLSFAEEQYLKRPGFLSGKLTGFNKEELEEKKSIYDAAKLEEQKKAYANPGSYEFTLTADDQKSFMEKFGDWLKDETIESPIGQMAGMEPREGAGPTKFRGVGGYDPFTDYLSYEAYEDAQEMPTETAEQRTAQEKAIKDAKALTNRWQRKGKTDNIIGNLFTPASLMTLEKKIGETFVKGSQNIGKGGLQSGLKGIRGQGSLTGAARQNAIQSGKLQLPAGAPQLPPAINNYIPNTIPSNFIQNPITGRMAGRTKGINDAFRTSGGLLDDYVPQLGDDFANTMGRSLDDFFPGAAKSGSNLPALKGFKPPATTGNLPATAGNFPALSSNLPSVTSKLPQTLKFGQNLGRGPQGFQSYSLLDDLGLAVGRNAGAQMGGVYQSALRDDYDPRRFGSTFASKPGADTTPDPKDGSTDGGKGSDGGVGEGGNKTIIPKGDWSTGDSDKYNLDMGNPSALMAIPGLAALVSGQMENNALNRMRGPSKPITTMMPQFNYKSNIGQQLQEVKDAGNAVMQNTNLQGQQAAALNQSVAAQRLKSNSGLLQQDAQQEQAARARYDAMSMQARMSNDALRNAYLQDSTNFDNKKEMLKSQARQQPLNVIASSAQDYLQNIYKPNLAAQLEGVGRPYDTGYDEEGNWIGYKNKD